MRGVMDELAMTNEHAGVRDVIGRAAKEEEISHPQMLAIHRNYTTPCGLQVCVAGHIDAPAAHQHLGESGAIVAQARASTPKIGHAQEALAKGNGFLDGQRPCIRVHVSVLNPCFLPVHEPHLQPAGIVARAFLLNFETRFKRNTQQRPASCADRWKARAHLR